jgi:hypothetical protein
VRHHNPSVTYVSPFGDPHVDHDNGPDPLCISREHSVNSDIDTLAEFYLAAVAAIEVEAAQPAFFLARQLAELALKALHCDYRGIQGSPKEPRPGRILGCPSCAGRRTSGR